MNEHNQTLDPMDHRSLGNKLRLFMFNSATPGMPFWLPAGAQLRKRLDDIIYEAHKRRGYQPVLSPAMMEDEMWKVSGHYENYRENMFPSEVEKRDYLLKPMNCPGHVIMYQHDVVSYKELPKRYFEFGQVHRNENAGSLHGLFRVREFTQDDAHIICREDQVEAEIIKVMEFIDDVLKTFGFEYSVEFSTRPDKSVGSDEVWEKAEKSVESALKTIGLKYTINEKDGAFYGPKLDVKIKDNNGRSWQLSTTQIDFNLPERFGMKYTDEQGEFQQPVMIHRAIFGSIERFLGILLENNKGLLPPAYSPYQVAIVPISGSDEKIMNYVSEVKNRLVHELGADVVVYDDNNTLNKRIKIAEEMKNPIIMILGNQEVDNQSVNLRHKIKLKRYEESLQDFIYHLKDEMKISI
jgi:threonyl-tRNA synthetase